MNNKKSPKNKVNKIEIGDNLKSVLLAMVAADEVNAYPVCEKLLPILEKIIKPTNQ